MHLTLVCGRLHAVILQQTRVSHHELSRNQLCEGWDYLTLHARPAMSEYAASCLMLHASQRHLAACPLLLVLVSSVLAELLFIAVYLLFAAGRGESGDAAERARRRTAGGP